MQTFGTIHPLDAEDASTIAPITTGAGTKAFAGDDEVLLDDALRSIVRAASLTHLREILSAATVRQPDEAFAKLDAGITPSPRRQSWPTS